MKNSKKTTKNSNLKKLNLLSVSLVLVLIMSFNVMASNVIITMDDNAPISDMILAIDLHTFLADNNYIITDDGMSPGAILHSGLNITSIPSDTIIFNIQEGVITSHGCTNEDTFAIFNGVQNNFENTNLVELDSACYDNLDFLNQQYNGCSAEGEISNPSLGPEYYKPCCEGLKSIYPYMNNYENLVGVGKICYNPLNGNPVCKFVNGVEGWYYSNGKLLKEYKCGAVNEQPTIPEYNLFEKFSMTENEIVEIKEVYKIRLDYFMTETQIGGTNENVYAKLVLTEPGKDFSNYVIIGIDVKLNEPKVVGDFTFKFIDYNDGKGTFIVEPSNLADIKKVNLNEEFTILAKDYVLIDGDLLIHFDGTAWATSSDNPDVILSYSPIIRGIMYEDYKYDMPLNQWPYFKQLDVDKLREMAGYTFECIKAVDSKTTLKVYKGDNPTTIEEITEEVEEEEKPIVGTTIIPNSEKYILSEGETIKVGNSVVKLNSILGIHYAIEVDEETSLEKPSPSPLYVAEIEITKKYDNGLSSSQKQQLKLNGYVQVDKYIVKFLDIKDEKAVFSVYPISNINTPTDIITETNYEDNSVNSNCEGCQVEKTCLDIGIRTISKETPVFCDLDKTLKKQKEESKTCQNNFECLSNSCMSGVCKDLSKQLDEQSSMLEKILSWFGRIFG